MEVRREWGPYAPYQGERWALADKRRWDVARCVAIDAKLRSMGSQFAPSTPFVPLDELDIQPMVAMPRYSRERTWRLPPQSIDCGPCTAGCGKIKYGRMNKPGPCSPACVAKLKAQRRKSRAVDATYEVPCRCGCGQASTQSDRQKRFATEECREKARKASAVAAQRAYDEKQRQEKLKAAGVVL